MSRSYYKKRDPGTLKGAQAALVAKLGTQPSDTARSRTTLQEYTDPDKPARNMPVSVVEELEKLAGDPVVTRYLAMVQGYLLIDTKPTEDTPYPVLLGEITSEAGELLTAAAPAIHGREADKALARVVKSKAMRLAAALAALIKDCDDIEGMDVA